jgi:hypothetical protein
MALSFPARCSTPLAALAALAGLLTGCNSGSSRSSAGPTCALPAAQTLSVVEVSPASGASGVFVGTNVSLRFNTCVDAASVGSTSVLLAAGTSFVSVALRYDAATATLVLDPSANLAYGQLHLVSVTGLRGVHGESMAGGFGSVFTTQGAPETIPPTTTASPSGGRYKAAQSVSLACADNAGGTGCAGTRYTVDGSTPTAGSPLYASPISIATDTVLRFFSVDVQGNGEAPRQEVYVIDTVPPALTGSDPSDGAAGVALTKVLTATFSEEMAPASLDAGTVTADNGLRFVLSWDAATDRLTLAPTERLSCATTYHVSIGAGATDVAGNALVQPAGFAFTTHADCVEPVTTASLAGGTFTTAQAVTLTCTDAGGSGCARIVYTTDGTIPSLAPANGIVVAGASAGPITLGEGDTTLRWFAEDGAGNREALKEQRYSVSTSGFTFVAMNGGIARGVGPTPSRFEPLLPGGRTNVFVRDPTNARLYRGSERGLLVSDGGEAFALLPAAPAGVLSVLPQGSKIVAGTSSGLYVSTDGGGTFVQRDLGGAAWVGAVVADGVDVFAATDSGVAVSHDRGTTFVLRTTADGLGALSVRDLVLAGGTLYAATAGGLSTSTDRGASFSSVSAGLGSASVNALVVSGSTVYAATDAGLSISSDGGASFTVTRTAASNGLGSDYVGAIAFDGTHLYACTGEPWVSGTADSFSVSSDATGSTFTPHPLSPSHASLRAESVQVEGTTVRVGAYPSYYLSTDAGVTFASMDLRGAVKRITGSGTSLYAAIQDSSGYGGVAVSTDRGRSFVVRDEGDGVPYSNVSSIAASGSYVYAGTFWGLGISSDGGTGFAKTNAIGGSVDCVWASGTTVWACSGSTLNLSTSSGTSFAQRLTGLSVPGGLAVSGQNVYLATGSGMWVSSSSGGAGTFALKGTAAGFTSAYLYDVAVDGNGTVLAATNDGLFASTDSGASFAAIPGAPIYPRGVFARGTTWYVADPSHGVAISQDGGATWIVRGSAEGISSANAVWFMP